LFARHGTPRKTPIRNRDRTLTHCLGCPMTMSRKDRFKLKVQLIDQVEADEWIFQKINHLLGEFGLETLEEDQSARMVGD
jgi:hypothetical protein